jgi:acetolactate synthase-1/2/3 large subunit
MRLIDTRNEQAASYIADAYGRLTRKVGVCAVSSGIAHINALAGVANAYFDGAPMLLITGASVHRSTDMGKFQEMDQIGLASPLCKYVKFVDRPELIPFYIQEAFAAATSGRPGPAHLTIPIDILETEVNPERVASARVGRVRGGSSGDPGLIGEAADLIAKSERPVLVVGSGAFYAGAEDALEKFVELTSMPVVVPIWDRGVVSKPSPCFMGVVGAASGGPRLLPDADLILIASARIDYRLGYGQPPTIEGGARVVRIDIDPEELRQGIEPDVGIAGDIRSILQGLTEELKRRGAKPHRAWSEEAGKRNRSFRQRWLDKPAPSSPPMTGRHIVDALRPFVKGDALFLIDGGYIGQWAHMVLCDRYPGHWLTCGASGVVGWGVPGAIAAKLAYPDRPVILLTGDGALTFAIAELESAVRQAGPLVIVLADDQAWGIVVGEQERAYGPGGVVASRMGPVRYDLVAEGFGAIGVRAERPEEIGKAIERGLKADRPTLIQVPIAVKGPVDEA